MHYFDFKGDLKTDYNAKRHKLTLGISSEQRHSDLERIMRCVSKKMKGAKVKKIAAVSLEHEFTIDKLQDCKLISNSVGETSTKTLPTD